MTVDELFAELHRLDGKSVAVAVHIADEWNPVLHAQGRLRHGVVDDPPEGGMGFGIGRVRRLNNDWAELELKREDIESAAWRDDLLPQGRRPVLAITMRGGALLTITPS